MYKRFIRPSLFKKDPETIHKDLIKAVKNCGQFTLVRNIIKHLYYAENSVTYHWKGLKFKNKIGLSAGFDKDASAYNELAMFGFGFIEIGTVTPHRNQGNPLPRIFRMEKCNSLISRTGFNNPGAEVIEKRLQKNHHHCIVGININKDPDTPEEFAATDFLSVFKRLYTFGDYFTVNWGSISSEAMQQVLETLTFFRNKQDKYRPILIKLPADITEEAMNFAIAMAQTYQTDGYVATGPTMDHSTLSCYTEKELNKIGIGGVSGKALTFKALKIVCSLREKVGNNTLIIGSGGIMNADDARRMKEAGANLIQIYSAFIYEGPGVIRKMAHTIGK